MAGVAKCLMGQSSPVPERRLCGVQVVRDPKLGKSGTYWSWNNESESFENQVSEEVSDGEKGRKLFDLSMKLLGLQEQA